MSENRCEFKTGLGAGKELGGNKMNIDKRIELLHKVQAEQKRRDEIEKEAERCLIAGELKKSQDVLAALDDSIIIGLFQELEDMK